MDCYVTKNGYRKRLMVFVTLLLTLILLFGCGPVVTEEEAINLAHSLLQNECHTESLASSIPITEYSVMAKTDAYYVLTVTGLFGYNHNSQNPYRLVYIYTDEKNSDGTTNSSFKKPFFNWELNFPQNGVNQNAKQTQCDTKHSI